MAKVLVDFIASSGSLENKAIFLEILHSNSIFRGYESLYQQFIAKESSLTFPSFTVDRWVEILMDEWPNKAGVIAELLEKATFENKLAIANTLSLSKDSKISEVGNHLCMALKASSFTEAVPHFNALIELFPNFNSTNITNIFGCLFVTFCDSRETRKEDPAFTRRLVFNGMKGVFVHGDLMMGVYDEHDDLSPYFLAYDMNTQKMVWGIPLRSISLEDSSLNTSATSMSQDNYSLKRVGESIFLQVVGEKKLPFIHPEIGKFESFLEVPEFYEDVDNLHMSPNGLIYQVVEKEGVRTLIGGRSIDKQWQLSFSSQTPEGSFLPLSTHCGFQHSYHLALFGPHKNPFLSHDSVDYLELCDLVLYGPTGDQITIKGCMTATAQDDKLYSIEKDSADEDKCLLNVRTLKDNCEVVSDVETSISLNVKRAFFGKICKNGQVVLFCKDKGGKGVNILPIFVTLDRQEVAYSTHKFSDSATHFVNADSGELWTWSKSSSEIWRVSSVNSELVGCMQSRESKTLVHVDKDNRLYFVNTNGTVGF